MFDCLLPHWLPELSWMKDGGFVILSSGLLYYLTRCHTTASQVPLADINERQQFEAELQQSRQKIINILESITDGFFTLDRQWKFTYLNRKAEKFLHRSRHKLLGKNIWEQFPEAIDTIFHQETYRALTEQVPVSFEGFYPPLKTWFEVHQYPSVEGLSIYFRDITQRKQAEETLKYQEKQLRLVTDALPVCISYVDRQLRYRFVNKTYQRWFGHTPEEIYGKLIQEVIGDAAYQLAKVYIDQVFAGNPVTFEAELPYLNGNRHITSTLVPDLDENSLVQGYYALITDITVQTQLKFALHQSEIQLNNILNSANAAITSFRAFADQTWKYEYRSAGCETVFGYTLAEFQANPHLWESRVLPEDLENALKPVFESIFQERPITIEYRFYHKDGTIHWIRSGYTSRRDDTQDCWLVTVVDTDISDTYRQQSYRQQAEEQIAFQASLLNQVRHAVIAIDLNGKIIYWNPFAEQMFQWRVNEVMGKELFEFVIPAEGKAIAQEILLEIRNSGYWEGEFMVCRKDGSVFPIHVVDTVLRDIQGNLIGYIGVSLDITERKAVEHMKDSFVSVVSHELRTPLTSIRGALGLIATGQLGSLVPEGQELLNIAVSESNRLVRLVNDILDLERIKSGHITLVKAACSLGELIHRALDGVRPIAQQAGILLESSLEFSPAVAMVWVDADRIQQTLMNLLNNAIKFSLANRKVLVIAERVTATNDSMPQMINLAKNPIAEDESLPLMTSLAKNRQDGVSDYVLIRIIDQGRGIPAHRLKAIFEPFEQVDASDSSHKGGTGLGLAICRSIIQQHGGKIWATSTLGEGSCFYFTLPLMS